MFVVAVNMSAKYNACFETSYPKRDSYWVILDHKYMYNLTLEFSFQQMILCARSTATKFVASCRHSSSKRVMPWRSSWAPSHAVSAGAKQGGDLEGVMRFVWGVTGLAMSCLRTT